MPKPGKKASNWVEKEGGLPSTIKRIAKHLKEKHPEWTESHCIAVAVNAVKKGAATGDLNFKGKQSMGAKGRARYSKAAAEWEAKKARSHTHSNEDAYEEVTDLSAEWEAIELATHALDTKAREKAADKGAALPDGSFPIRDKAELKKAILALGRAKSQARAKAHIIKRAKALGAMNLLPAAWGPSTKEEK